MKIQRLKNDDWIAAPSRAVFIDFTVWNMNLNLHAVIRIVAEFSRSGVCETNTRVIVIQPRQLYPLSTSGIWDMLALVGEFILTLFILFYIAEEMTESSITWHKYFLDPWNVIDWINLTLLIIYVGVRIMIYIEAIYPPPLGSEQLKNPDQSREVCRIHAVCENSAYDSRDLLETVFEFSLHVLGHFPRVRHRLHRWVR